MNGNRRPPTSPSYPISPCSYHYSNPSEDPSPSTGTRYIPQMAIMPGPDPRPLLISRSPLSGLSVRRAVFDLVFEVLKDATFLAQRKLELLSLPQIPLDAAGTKRLAFEVALNPPSERYTQDEDDKVATGKRAISEFMDNPNKTEFSKGSPLSTNFILFEKGENFATILSKIELNCSYEQALAWNWDLMANCRQADNVVDRAILERVNSHHQLYCVCHAGTTHGGLLDFHPREFVNDEVYNVFTDPIAGHSAISVSSPCKHLLRPIDREDRVRATAYRVCNFEQLPTGRCLFTLLVKANGGGSVPVWVLNHYSKNFALYTTDLQQYFQKLRGLGELTVHDGVVLAETCMLRVENEKARANEQEICPFHVRINELFTKYRALRELGLLNPAASSMMTACVRNKFAKAPDVYSTLAKLNQADGTNIGRGLALALITNTLPETGVDEWIHRYPALQELDRKYTFFRPMMTILAKRIMQSSNSGAKYRACSGAALSLMDMYSDLMMAYRFYMAGQIFFARFIITTVFSNTFMQLLIVYAQNRKMGKSHLLLELAMTICQMKPAFDAVRVSTGAKQDPLQVWDAEKEMVLSRATEIVFESVPSGVLQIYAALQAHERDNVAMWSILMSASCTAFGGTVISWDFDVSPLKRKMTPIFYGYIKNDPTSRTLTFLVMFTITLCHVLMKTLSAALLMSISKVWMMWYLVGDIFCYMMFKIMRCDFRYCFNVPGVLGLLVSFFIRLVVKILIDYTCCFQFRHCYDTGGLLFCILILQNQVCCFVIAYAYLNWSGDTGDVGVFNKTKIMDTTDLDFLNATNATDIVNLSNNNTDTAVSPSNKTPSGVLWSFLSSLLLLFYLSLTAFIVLIEKKYLYTFVSTGTGPGFAVGVYHSSTTDETKMDIFSHHPVYYESISEELKVYVNQNWDEWIKDMPEWFNANLICNIPDEYIPAAEVTRLDRESVGGRRRKSSVADAMGFGGTGGGGGERKGSKVFPDPKDRRVND